MAPRGAADLAPLHEDTSHLRRRRRLRARRPEWAQLPLRRPRARLRRDRERPRRLEARPFWSGFLIFSDFARGAIRLSALMEIPVIHIFTHDSIGVGEDGPTHQPVEHLVSLRAIPGSSSSGPRTRTRSRRLALRRAAQAGAGGARSSHGRRCRPSTGRRWRRRRRSPRVHTSSWTRRGARRRPHRDGIGGRPRAVRTGRARRGGGRRTRREHALLRALRPAAAGVP